MLFGVHVTGCSERLQKQKMGPPRWETTTVPRGCRWLQRYHSGCYQTKLRRWQVVNRGYQTTTGENIVLTDSLMLYCTSHSMSAWLQIRKFYVDRQKRSSDLQYCRLAIMWKGEPTDTFPFVSRQVNLKGTGNSDDYFIIKLPERGNILGSETFELLSVPFSKAINLTGNHACMLLCTKLSV